MQVTISYTLSEKAQRSLIAATGHPVSRAQKHTIEIGPDEVRFCDVAADGSLTRTLGYSYINHVSQSIAGVDAAKTPEEAWRLYKAGQAAAEEAMRLKQEDEQRRSAESLAATEAADAKAAEYVEMQPAKLGGYYDMRSMAMRAAGVASPNWNAKLPKLQLAISRLEDRTDALVQQKKAEEATKEAAKLQYVASWIIEYGEPTIQKQFAAGALCKKFALSMIADAAFLAAGVPDEDQPKLCQRDGCGCGRKDITCIPTEEFSRWLEIKSALPEGTVVEFEQVRECLRDEEGYAEEDSADPYFAALIKMPVGPFTFERLIKL